MAETHWRPIRLCATTTAAATTRTLNYLAVRWNATSKTKTKKKTKKVNRNIAREECRGHNTYCIQFPSLAAH